MTTNYTFSVWPMVAFDARCQFGKLRRYFGRPYVLHTAREVFPSLDEDHIHG